MDLFGDVRRKSLEESIQGMIDHYENHLKELREERNNPETNSKMKDVLLGKCSTLNIIIYELKVFLAIEKSRKVCDIDE